MLTLRASWITRPVSATRAWFARAYAAVTSTFRRTPPEGGVTTGTVARKVRAEEDLAAIARSPAVFAAVRSNAARMTTFPIRVYAGAVMDAGGAKVLSPRIPWVGSLMRLLARPDPDTADQLAPEPGEGLIAQIIADLDLCGVFVVAPVLTGEVPLDSDIVGLRRLHPRLCTLEVLEGRRWLRYQPRGGTAPMFYPRGSVFIGRLPAWQASEQAQMGTGAGEALGPLVDAERMALEQTARKIDQGGADTMIVAKTPAGAAYLKSEENRKELVRRVTEAMRGEDGSRVFAVGGEIEVQPAGLKPADMQAPELLDRAPRLELMALGTAPVAVGGDAGNYANGVLQWRAQADADEGRASVVEAYLLRPLAQHFARRAGSRYSWLDITARIDLSQHIGYAYVRTETLTRVQSWMRCGWSAEQAAQLEGLDAPPPTGTVMLAGQAATPGPDAGQHLDGPREPVGSGGDPSPTDNQTPKRDAFGPLYALFGAEMTPAEAK